MILLRPLGASPASAANQQPTGQASPAAHALAHMRAGPAFAVGVGLGLALGIVVAETTAVPSAPEAGLLLGVRVSWFWRRHGA